MEEKVFFKQGNVSVSNSRFIVSGQTYAMNGVTSVKTARVDPSRLWPLILILIGLCFLAGSLPAVGFGVIVIALAIFWLTQQKPTLIVVLSSSSGEAKALSSKDATFINGVIDALNNAIVYRG